MYHRARLVALFASMVVALVAGTPYLYGVYSPQLVQRIGLSTSDAATISVAVNMGSGLGGLPAGLLIDRMGPQLAIFVGSVCIFLGYFSLYRIYQHMVSSLPLVCVSMVLIGFGSVISFFSGLKAAQANFPNHRGAAGAFPVGAYGLAATLFSIIAAHYFDNNAGGLIRFLALFCGSVAFCGSWLVHVYPRGEDGEPVLKRAPSFRGSFSFWGIGNRTPRSSVASLPSEVAPLVQSLRASKNLTNKSSYASLTQSTAISSETSSIDREALAGVEQEPISGAVANTIASKPSSSAVVKGLICNRTFETHYLINALCSGVCQMYIYTIGFIVRAQFQYNDIEGSPAAAQAIQVSTISLASFGGRVIAGVVSDHIYKKWKGQRMWILLGTIALALTSQVLLYKSNSVSTITWISLFIGGGYGLLNGTYPAIIADEFGTENFTTAWGLISSGPLFILFSLEKYFGYIYDHHSDSKGVCDAGNKCYRGAFEVSAMICVLTSIIVGTLMYKRSRRTSA